MAGGARLVILHYNAPHNCLLPYMEHNREASQSESQPESQPSTKTSVVFTDDIFIPSPVVSSQ